MTKIYDFFAFTNDSPTISTVDSAEFQAAVKSDTTALLELYNLSVRGVEKLNDNELLSLHNALIRVKYFQETGKVLTEKGLK